MLNQELSIDDDYSAEVIRLAKAYSPDIEAWFEERRYLTEASEDTLKPLWFRHRCIVKIHEELGNMGIVIGKSADDVCDDPVLVYACLTLRSKFDHDNIKSLLKSHRDLFDIVFAESDEEVFERIIDWTRDVLPLDEGWQRIYETMDDNPGIFSADAEFVKMIRGVVEEIDCLGEPDVTESVDQEVVIKFINFLQKRQKYVMDVLESIWIKRVEGPNQDTRRTAMQNIVFGGFEKELGSKACIERNAMEFIGLDLSNREAISEFLNKIRAPYLKRWSHCLEYYFGEEKKNFKTNDVVVLFATLIVDYPDVTKLHPGIVQKLAEYEEHLGTDAVKTLTQVFEDTIIQLATIPEINYNETK